MPAGSEACRIPQCALFSCIVDGRFPIPPPCTGPPTTMPDTEAPQCGVCNISNRRKRPIQCGTCHTWYHRSCVGVSGAVAAVLTVWTCTSCGPSVSSNRAPTRNADDCFEEDRFTTIFPKILAALRKSTRVISHVPRGARADAASVLGSLMMRALDVETPQAWPCMG